VSPAAILEPSARIVKALTLAVLADAAGISSSDVASFHPSEWRMLAKAAQTKRAPSPQTCGLVADLLRRRETARALLAGVKLLQ
jgi:hypothetical protein